MVIKETKVLHPMHLRVLSLISQPNNGVVGPSKTRVFAQKNLMLVVAYTVIIIMSVPYLPYMYQVWESQEDASLGSQPIA